MRRRLGAAATADAVAPDAGDSLDPRLRRPRQELRRMDRRLPYLPPLGGGRAGAARTSARPASLPRSRAREGSSRRNDKPARPAAATRCPEQPLELPPQRHVDLRQRHRVAEIDQAGDAVARVGDAAGHDAGEVRQVRIDVERDAVRLTQRLSRMPMAAILSSWPAPRSGRATHTPTRSSRRSPRTLKRGERPDQPLLQRRDEAAHVRPRAASGRASHRRPAGRGRDR